MTPEEINTVVDDLVIGQGNQMRASVVGPVLKSLAEGKASMGSPAAFKETTSYSEGDVVEKDGKWYKFSTSHTGAWDADDVDEVTLYDLYVALEERVAALEA